MTSKELVINTINFTNKNRVPRQLWDLQWASNKFPEELKQINTNFPDDLIYSPEFYKEKPILFGDRHKKGIFKDAWGCEFFNLQDGIIGEVKTPLLKDWSDITNIRIPKQLLTTDINKVNKFCLENNDKFILSPLLARPFEQLQFMRKPEVLYMDLYDYPNEIKSILNILHEFYLELINIWVKTDIDGIFIMDDWGSQNNLLISPVMWKEIFKPMYKDYIKLAHENDKYVFMHSDGYILDIYDDLIEIGIDAINSQIFCMGIDKLSKYKGKITFWGEIDRQHILSSGTKVDVKNAVKNIYNNLYDNGGVIAQCEFGPGTKPENVYSVFEEWGKLII